MVLSFVWLVSMLPIVTLTVMSSFSVASVLLILLSPLFCAAISIRSLIVLWIAVARVLLASLVKVPLCCLVCFRIVVLWIFGVKCILLFLHLLGVGLKGPLLLALTSSVARMFGCLMCLLWTFYLAPFSDHCALFFLGSFLTLCPWAQGCGN